ncbi:MAG: LPS export ABC transporter periplasmic protein LptC [candidate division WOR-3 bacterium]
MEKTQKVILILFLILGFCKKSEVPKKEKTESGFEGIHLIESRGKVKSFELFAKNVVDREDSVFLYNFKVIFYDSDGVKIGELKGDSGWVNKKNLNILARKNVILKHEKESLFTEEIIWIDSLKVAKSDKDVVFFQENNVTYGKGFITKRNLKEIIIKGRVKGEGE